MTPTSSKKYHIHCPSCLSPAWHTKTKPYPGMPIVTKDWFNSKTGEQAVGRDVIRCPYCAASIGLMHFNDGNMTEEHVYEHNPGSLGQDQLDNAYGGGPQDSGGSGQHLAGSEGEAPGAPEAD